MEPDLGHCRAGDKEERSGVRVQTTVEENTMGERSGVRVQHCRGKDKEERSRFRVQTTVEEETRRRGQRLGFGPLLGRRQGREFRG